MGLIADGKVIIEVGLNEWATKKQNPNVPYGIEEVIAAGIACARAGAAVLHFHARADDGAQLWTAADVYRAEMEGIAAHVDVLTCPSYNADFSHIWQLLDEPPRDAPLDIAPFDVYQGVGHVTSDELTKSFRERVSDIAALADRKGANPSELAEMARRRVTPTVCALLSHVTAEMEPMIVPSSMSSRHDTEVLLRHAMRRGAHIRVGIGDNPVGFPTETNAELVEWAVDLARDEGLEPATPSEVRAFFRI